MALLPSGTLAVTKPLKIYIQQAQRGISSCYERHYAIIGVETLSQCLETAEAIQKQNFGLYFDYMGKAHRDATMAQQFHRGFLRLFRPLLSKSSMPRFAGPFAHWAGSRKQTWLLAMLYLTQAGNTSWDRMMIIWKALSDRQIIEMHKACANTSTMWKLPCRRNLYRTADDLSLL